MLAACLYGRTGVVCQWVYVWLSCVLSLDNPQCSVHLINNGVTIENNSVTIEFDGTGPSEEIVVSEFVCRLDDEEFVTCKFVDERNWKYI